MGRNVVSKLIVGISVGLFLISLTQPAFSTDAQNPAAREPLSFALLITGWMGLVDGKIAWFANPALLKGWRTAKEDARRIESLSFSLVALALALSFLLHDEIIVDEGGSKRAILSYCAGYWLWVSSISTLALGNLMLIVGSRTKE